MVRGGCVQQPLMAAEYLRQALSEAVRVLSAALSCEHHLRQYVADIRTTLDRCRDESAASAEDAERLLHATDRANLLLRDPNGRLHTKTDVLLADWKFLLDQARIWIERNQAPAALVPSREDWVDRLRYAYQQLLALMLLVKSKRAALDAIVSLRNELQDLHDAAVALPAVRAAWFTAQPLRGTSRLPAQSALDRQ